ncbi:MAG: PrsW family intramembrane metalloprotease [Melioribacteraceae bacterium]|nr:PrsW family intramembrane metalloprotease [Melioribacteraceae bacterium]
MPINASLFAAIIPMLLYLLIIWRMDKYDREPFQFLLLHFLWGAFGAIVLGLIGSLALESFTGYNNDGESRDSLIQTILFAPVSEEIAKGVFLLWSVNSRKFDNITDGLVYGGAIGLGFGMTENFTYYITYGDSFSSWIFLVFVRSGFSAVMHCISTATFGAFLGMSKFNLSSYKRILPFIGISLAIFFHLMWNLSVSFSSTFLLGFIFMLFLITYFFQLFRYVLKQEKKVIEHELLEESDLINLPKEHILILSSPLRFKKGWIEESIRKNYFRAAIRLAFKKMQSKNSTGYLKASYDYEVEQLRNLIKNYLTVDKIA